MPKNEVVKVDFNSLPVVGLGAADDLFEKLAQQSSFFERIQLYSKGRAIDKQLITPGCFGVPVDKDTIQNLGSEIDIIPLAMRDKALDAKNTDAILASYDSSSPLYQQIKARAADKNSKCMWGYTFLVFERSTGKFYEYFLGTISSRMEAAKIAMFLPRTPEREAAMEKSLGKKPLPSGPCTLKIKYISKADRGWHVPVTFPCSTPFTNFSIEAAQEQIRKFMALKDSDIEKAEDPLAGRAH